MADSAFDAPVTPGMIDGADVLARLEAVRHRLVTSELPMPSDRSVDLDPDAPEDHWRPSQIRAHLSETVGYWHSELVRMIGEYDGTPAPFGRHENDAGRIAAIQVGAAEPAAVQIERASDAIIELEGFLKRLTSPEWNVVGIHQDAGEMDIEAIVERFVVEHLERHADTLSEAHDAATR